MFLRMSAAAAPPAPGSRSRERACPPWAARRGRTAPHSSGTDTRGETAICYWLLWFAEQSIAFILLNKIPASCLIVTVPVLVLLSSWWRRSRSESYSHYPADVSPLGRAGVWHVSGPAPGHLHTGIVTTSEHRGITAEYNPILLFTATLWKWETENVNVISAGSEGLTGTGETKLHSTYLQ